MMRTMRVLLLMYIVVGCLLNIVEANTSPQQTCETALIALKKGALELENRLKRCKQDEKQHCDELLSVTQQELSREKDVSQRLRELLSAKDLEKSISIKELESAHKEALERLEGESKELKTNLEQQKKDAIKAKQLTEELQDEKKKAAALAYSLNECKENFEKKTTDEVATLREKVEKQTAKLESYKETLEARDAEIETLRKLAVKLEEQKRAGILEWFNNPNSLESLLEARNKTIGLLSPGLDATERRLLELRAMSSAKIESLIGDHDTSILMSGLLAWGILLIPFFLSFCLLVRVRLSLSKMVLWASLYAALFCLVMFGFSYALGKEALGSLRRLSVLSHDIMLILIMLGHVLQILSIYLLTLKQWLVTDLGSLRARHMLQFAVPVLIALHYYYFYYFSAISSGDDTDGEEFAGDEDFDWRYWLVYAVAYFFVCVLVVLGNSSSSAASSGHVHIPPSTTVKPSPAVSAAANVVTSIVEAVEGDQGNQRDEATDSATSTNDPDLEAGTPNSSSPPPVEKPKSKKKKKSKHETSSLEFLGPDEVMDAVVSATRATKSDEKGD